VKALWKQEGAKSCASLRFGTGGRWPLPYLPDSRVSWASGECRFTTDLRPLT
jgi:hypothetical protein